MKIFLNRLIGIIFIMIGIIVIFNFHLDSNMNELYYDNFKYTSNVILSGIDGFNFNYSATLNDVGDYYEGIIIHQCGNCGTRFLSLNHSEGGFIKEINTVTSSNKPKTFKLKTVSYKSFEELSGSDKLNAVRYALSDEVNLEDIKNFTEEQEKQKQAKKSKRGFLKCVII